VLSGLHADRVVGALVLVKAVDVLARGPSALPAPAWVLVLAAFVSGGAGLAAGTVRRTPGCWALVLGGAAVLAVDFPVDLRRQHLVLLMGVALVALVARDADERLLLWRVQLTALYGVAALAKLNESFLGGDVLVRAVVDAPLWSAVLPLPPPALLVGAGTLLVAAELALAVTPWVARLRVAGTVVAALLHGGVLLLVSTDPLVAVRLVVFGGTAVLLHAVSAGLVPAVRAARR
jgi:hypothetical protein